MSQSCWNEEAPVCLGNLSYTLVTVVTLQTSVGVCNIWFKFVCSIRCVRRHSKAEFVHYNIKILSNDVNKFRYALKRFLQVGPFYSLGEYFEWKTRDDLDSHE
jgi:hypothetical protein